MNGRVSKRIRRAAWISSSRHPLQLRRTIKRLKKEYKRLPYHQCKTPEIIGHSALLRRHHAAGWSQS